MSPFQAAVMFAAMAEKIHKAEEHALKRAAEIVEAEAKSEIGHYQGAAGPFAAWAPLADSTKDDRVRQGYPADEPLLRTGEMRDSIEHTVRMKGFASGEAHVGSNDDKALWQELGTKTIPPRSFLGGAAFRKSHEVKHILGDAAVATIAGKKAI